MKFYNYFLLLFLALFFSLGCSAQTISSEKTAANIEKIAVLGKSRAAHTATRLADGKVLITGGMQRNGVFYDEAEIFDPETNRFAKVRARMAAPRVSHTATPLADGRVLIVGGWSDRTGPTRSAEIFDPRTQRFAPAGQTHLARSGHTATSLADGRVLVAGGYDGDQNLDAAEIFDPEKNSFHPVGKMRRKRNVHSAVRLKDGRILLTGGETSKRGPVAAKAEIFDPETDEFLSVKAEMNAARYKHDSVLLADGSVLIFGGSDERDARGKLKSAEIFNPVQQTFTPTESMNAARFKIGQTAVLLPDGRVLIGGGGAKAELFDPRTRSFTQISGGPGTALHYATVTLLADGRALIVGGYEFIRGGEPTSTNQAWIYRV